MPAERRDHLIDPAQIEVLPGAKGYRLRGGGDMQAVAAAIQNNIKPLVDVAHGDLKNIEILQPQADKPLRRITVGDLRRRSK